MPISNPQKFWSSLCPIFECIEFADKHIEQISAENSFIVMNKYFPSFFTSEDNDSVLNVSFGACR